LRRSTPLEKTMETRTERPKTSRDPDVDAKALLLAASPLASVDDESRHALAEIGRLEVIRKPERLTDEGLVPRGVFVIGAGRVKVERAAGSRVVPLGHRGPGEIIGEAALLGGPAHESATVVDDVRTLVLPIAGLKRLFQQDPSVQMALLGSQVDRAVLVQHRLASLLRLGVEARLAEFLRHASHRWGRAHPAGEIVSAPFTHAEIATLIGSTRETVTLLLGKMKREGVISFDRRRIVVKAPAELEKRACGEVGSSSIAPKSE
jgi:CRP-like cAMP-binding protein